MIQLGEVKAPAVEPARQRAPRLGFLGVGWIGRNRMEAIVKSGHGQVVAVSDPSPEMAKAASELAPDLEKAGSLDALLESDLDGLVIATPSALHAEQSIAALERGVAVFCQKPLGRTAEECQRVVDAARANDVLLGVDLSYRFVAGVPQLRELVQGGAIGHVYAVNLVFHNAYGPDKAWFYDPKQAGGGCVMDLGIHLVDLALWTLGFPEVTSVASLLHAKGRRIRGREQVEDYASAQLELATGAAVSLQCSWRLPAGQDAVIEASFYGTEGGLAFRNVNGSFYDFTVERLRGTSREVLTRPPDAWGGRAGVDWARRLEEGSGFDPSVERIVEVARTLDRIYGS